MFPAVAILGPRQVGKTTLARTTFADRPYLDLEAPPTRDAFLADPLFQLEAHASSGVILDEAQAVPAIFPALRGLIDGDRSARGKYILLGSAEPALVRSISESLAGRIDPAALAAAIRVRELLSVAWLASRVGEDSQVAVRARHRLSDALSGRDGSWLA